MSSLQGFTSPIYTSNTPHAPAVVENSGQISGYSLTSSESQGMAQELSNRVSTIVLECFENGPVTSTEEKSGYKSDQATVDSLSEEKPPQFLAFNALIQSKDREVVKEKDFFLWYLHQAWLLSAYETRSSPIQLQIRQMILNAWRKGASQSGCRAPEGVQRTPLHSEGYYRLSGGLAFFLEAQKWVEEELGKKFHAMPINSPKLLRAEIARGDPHYSMVTIETLEDFHDELDMYFHMVIDEHDAGEWRLDFDYTSLIGQVDENGQIITLDGDEVLSLLHRRIEKFLEDNPNLSLLQLLHLFLFFQKIGLCAFQKYYGTYVFLEIPKERIWESHRVTTSSQQGKSLQEMIDERISYLLYYFSEANLSSKAEDSSSTLHEERKKIENHVVNFRSYFDLVMAKTRNLSSLQTKINATIALWEKGVERQEIDQEIKKIEFELAIEKTRQYYSYYSSYGKYYCQFLEIEIENLTQRVLYNERTTPDGQYSQKIQKQHEVIKNFFTSVRRHVAHIKREMQKLLQIGNKGSCDHLVSKGFVEFIFIDTFHRRGLLPTPDILIAMLMKMASSPLVFKAFLEGNHVELASQKQSVPKLDRENLLHYKEESFEEFLKSPIIEKFHSLTREKGFKNLTKQEYQQFKALVEKEENLAKFKGITEKEFKKLTLKDFSDEDQTQHLLQSRAVVNMLRGLNELPLLAGKSIDLVFAEKGVSDLLKIGYTSIALAMKEAIIQQEDRVAFTNQIELIQQIIQDILYILQPYSYEDLTTSLSQQLTQNHPLSNGLYLKGHVCSSGMYALSNVLAAVEAEEKTNRLNVVVLKDTYYEAADWMKDCKTYSLFALDGDRFNEEGIKQALTKNDSPVTQLQNEEKINLFLCEFHHNISVTRQVYREEKIVKQINAMAEKGILAEKCTLVCDTTMSGEDVIIEKLLQDEAIRKFCEKGRLNIVLIRSGLKFDQMGRDSNYSGFATVINNGKNWMTCNASFDDADHRIQGPSLQGICHFIKYARQEVNSYLEEAIKNTQLAYSKLDKKLLACSDSANVIQIARMEDRSLCFLDIKAVDSSVAMIVVQALSYHAKKKGIPLFMRPSFGFVFSNQMMIDHHQWRVNIVTHPHFYADFFNTVQSIIDRVREETDRDEKRAISEIPVDLEKEEKIRKIAEIKQSSKSLFDSAIKLEIESHFHA